MIKPLTPRGKALRWLTNHRGITEDPPGSNSDHRVDGIRTAQNRIGSWVVEEPWCGTWAYSALKAAGVKNLTVRMASVAMIEDDARAMAHCYRGWTMDVRKALRGDLVVLFGRGIHVEVLRSNAWIYRRFGRIVTDGGNTSSGNAGSQDNGGGAYRRVRKISDVHGFALVDYPG